MRLAKSLIEFYALSLPYHRGKWRVIEALLKLSGVEAQDSRKAEVVKRGGLLWRLTPACLVQRRLYYHGAFDVNDLRELSARLPKNPVFLDIGAYFGYYAYKIRDFVGPSATVHAFEPVPANFALLEENRTLNHFEDVQLHRTALSDREGTVEFEVPSEGNGGVGHIANSGTGGAVSVAVPCTTLDAFTQAQGLRGIDALKLDVEGAELQVIQGGAETLRNFKPVMLMELNPPCLARFGTNQEEVLRALRELGYGFFRATPTGLAPFEGLNPEESYTNIICLPKSDSAPGK